MPGGGAAAARQRRQRDEEEHMTNYTNHDLADGWEFKILRSAVGAFKKPEVLRAILAEEERAGWMLVEKFDTQRVRLKRPVSARANDHTLGFDPYRTTIGLSEGQLGFIIVGSGFALMLMLITIMAIAAAFSK